MLNIYCIGGLGVDERVFKELTLTFPILPLKWIAPEPRESLQKYSTRLLQQIDQEQPFALIGVSFGGMVAIELNKLAKAQKLILISSATTKKDIPVAFRFFGKTGLLNILPEFFLKPPQRMINWFFGVSKKKNKVFLEQIIQDTDSTFLRWAMLQITKWENTDSPQNMLRIHGSADRLLHSSLENGAIVVPNAGHFMIVNKAKEISNLLNGAFEKK